MKKDGNKLGKRKTKILLNKEYRVELGNIFNRSRQIGKNLEVAGALSSIMYKNKRSYNHEVNMEIGLYGNIEKGLPGVCFVGGSIKHEELVEYTRNILSDITVAMPKYHETDLTDIEFDKFNHIDMVRDEMNNISYYAIMKPGIPSTSPARIPNIIQDDKSNPWYKELPTYEEIISTPKLTYDYISSYTPQKIIIDKKLNSHIIKQKICKILKSNSLIRTPNQINSLVQKIQKQGYIIKGDL